MKSNRDPVASIFCLIFGLSEEWKPSHTNKLFSSFRSIQYAQEFPSTLPSKRLIFPFYRNLHRVLQEAAKYTRECSNEELYGPHLEKLYDYNMAKEEFLEVYSNKSSLRPVVEFGQDRMRGASRQMEYNEMRCHFHLESQFLRFDYRTEKKSLISIIFSNCSEGLASFPKEKSTNCPVTFCFLITSSPMKLAM